MIYVLACLCVVQSPPPTTRPPILAKAEARIAHEVTRREVYAAWWRSRKEAEAFAPRLPKARRAGYIAKKADEAKGAIRKDVPGLPGDAARSKEFVESAIERGDREKWEGRLADRPALIEKAIYNIEAEDWIEKRYPRPRGQAIVGLSLMESQRISEAAALGAPRIEDVPSSLCNALTTDGLCSRKVAGGGRPCYLHRAEASSGP